ncbi:pimeloyl-ACP methyl ester carboxylesterase [Rhodobacter aestuarii]|uniref:Pimeloyl-ACP methyl ester carboxylesterase n=1 Tax=Rhodobacter aestuarii TaxID=453582 RepID=A0A1N7NGX3_9RHOB|nr:alpha/beta hydrolase [Rhodobacter aestuarii]PTV96455.1 pimeloyl-ACP methyl ester carboxylesterase [Rhodobacter aestuarii]SIS97429.1 Pimeloyl-ACP methyl ester carboxylesterase [Rhodobacter aestuarii]
MELQQFIAPDGAKLAWRDQGEGAALIMLPGLTRTGADFDYLLPHLPGGLRVIRPDYRGRGGSDWTGAASYTVIQEAADLVALMDHLGLEKAALLGTSRGGMIAMYMAAVPEMRARLTGICLNDIGPVIEHDGLMRIFDYLGRNPVAKTYAELAEALPRLMAGFANVPASRWAEEVTRHYHETAQGLRINYDPALRESFLAAFQGGKVPAAWPLFEACAGLPLALLRGANSDLLSRDTVAEMRRRRPDMLFAEVPDRAHIPFLDEPESIALIREWLAQISA